MYEAHFGLNTRPFSITPDPEFLFWTPAHSRAARLLRDAVVRRNPLTVLTGEIGSGKTTLVQHFLHALDPGTRVALLNHYVGGTGDFARWVLVAFDVALPASPPRGAPQPASAEARPDTRPDAMIHLHDWLRHGPPAVVIVDEAQNLTDRDIEAVRLLTNLNDAAVHLSIVLAGQPELRDRLSGPHMEGLRQRIGGWAHLGPLGPGEVAEYIAVRTAIAGASAPLFDAAATAAIAEASGGIPRLVNVLADLCLVEAFVDDLAAVDGVCAATAIRQARDGFLPALTPAPRDAGAARAGPADGRRASAPPARPVPGGRLQPTGRAATTAVHRNNVTAFRRIEPASAVARATRTDADALQDGAYPDVERNDDLVDGLPRADHGALVDEDPATADGGRALMLRPDEVDRFDFTPARPDPASQAPPPTPATAPSPPRPPHRDRPTAEPQDPALPAAPAPSPSEPGASRVAGADEGAAAEGRPGRSRRLGARLSGAMNAALAAFLFAAVAAPALRAPPVVETAPLDLSDAGTLPGDPAGRLDAALALAAVDPAAGAIAYARAALSGQGRAAYYLAQHYETGDGVPVDHALARAWYERSDSRRAQRRIDALPPPEGGPVGAPVPLAAAWSGGAVELVWRPAAGGDAPGYVVEFAREPGGDVLATRETRLSAIAATPPAGAEVWRVRAGEARSAWALLP